MPAGDPFASGWALKGGGTPILCDTGSDFELKLAAHQNQTRNKNNSHDQEVGKKGHSH